MKDGLIIPSFRVVAHREIEGNGGAAEPAHGGEELALLSAVEIGVGASGSFEQLGFEGHIDAGVVEAEVARQVHFDADLVHAFRPVDAVLSVERVDDALANRRIVSSSRANVAL